MLEGQPEFDGFGLGAGHALDEAQQGFSSGHVREIFFAVGGGHFQLVTICYQLTALFGQAAFEDFPVFSGRLIIRLLGEHADDVHDGKPPRLGSVVVVAANLVPFKNGEVTIHGDGMSVR